MMISPGVLGSGTAESDVLIMGNPFEGAMWRKVASPFDDADPLGSWAVPWVASPSPLEGDFDFQNGYLC